MCNVAVMVVVVETAVSCTVLCAVSALGLVAVETHPPTGSAYAPTVKIWLPDARNVADADAAQSAMELMTMERICQ